MSGAARTLISPEEYLSMSFGDREPEYVRGELIYKPMPDYAHSFLQMILGTMLNNALLPLGYNVLSEIRSRLAADNYRLPDVAVYGPDQAVEPVPTQPPVIAIEIISKDENHSHILEKLDDYQAWGVPNIWTVDPRRRKLSVFVDSTLKNVESLSLPGTPFEVRMAELLKHLRPGVL